ncbi:PhzF family phenazine biosynthesis isomerase [Pseudomonas syringae]|uniref:PhzF family phenazine biosynthesis protein n=1 Tax=Pseudomonas TaxID=286 RepID=UPI0006B8E434|nr:PhzF family phenazine biosynthesis isomerase [Pseudomonas syringae]KWS25891.1 hypothetical protein AL061_16950 [Pseudomonas syringae pv. syringae]MCH5498963.1 PhzF family phenazine biosynthesis isomerase [Pseudomonas syringae pv. syringae]MCH5525010.1 PhzF family phenazine biosynthesis isomerase [Pseudomonas syringae pv. syringae]MCH5560338.1 PhzF family phenazine biosynthesis isomerase [Pseudomonas syringae pv. syringae]MCH5565187.1 PhzF family phenazine biosynthesis isomerase [Pseudomonas
MPNTLSFHQVDVFASKPLEGNALAVVSDADDLTAEQMAAFARWTNLSETTFLMRPTHPDADYRVRIFTPMRELPFAGHPTLGSCYVWLGDNGVRAFISNRSAEDPVTGSLNASLAQWLIPAGLMPKRYTVSQGTALGRHGRIQVEHIGERIWIGGEVQKCITGRVSF